jgi:hypothetical protein
LVAGIKKARQLRVNVAPFISIHYLLNEFLSRYGVQPGTRTGITTPSSSLNSGRTT